MLGVHVVDAHVPGLEHGQLQRLFHPGAERQVDGLHVGLRLPHGLLDLGLDALQVEPQGDHRLTGRAAALVDQAQQDVLGLHHGVSHAKSLVVGQLDDFFTALRKELPHFYCSP